MDDMDDMDTLKGPSFANASCIYISVYNTFIKVSRLRIDFNILINLKELDVFILFFIHKLLVTEYYLPHFQLSYVTNFRVSLLLCRLMNNRTYEVLRMKTP